MDPKNNQEETVTAPVIDEGEMETNWDGMVDTFDELPLKKELLRGNTSHVIFFRNLWLWL